jgi:two-component sensor histidine kinase
MRYIFILLLWTATIFGQNVTVLEKNIYIDAEHSWTENDAYKNKDKFIPLATNKESLGFSESTVWLYVKVKNNTDKFSHEVIEFVYPLHDYLDVYAYESATLVDSYSTGDHRDFNTREVETNNFVIPYMLAVGEEKEFIFKINSTSSLNIGMKFFSFREYYVHSSENKLFLGAYYGAVIIMLIYNFILFLMIRKRIYFDYVVFHLFYLFIHLAVNGFAFEYFFPNMPMIAEYFIIVVLPLGIYFGIKFSLSFLSLNDYLPKTHKFLHIVMKMLLLLLLSGFFISYSLFITISTLAGAFVSFVLFVVGLYMLFTYKTMASKFYVTAWGFLLVGAFIGLLQNLGFISMSVWSFYSSQIGAFMELSLLSFALAYRYNTLFVKLSSTEQELRVLNINLEHKVEERTLDLHERNNELSLEISNKNMLFKELYHRVKNNLQIITSLLTLQIDRIKDKKAIFIISEMTQRIKAMSMIHEKLYQTDNLSLVNMQEYTQGLANDLQQGVSPDTLHFEIDCEEIELNLVVAVPMGLIINELVTNAIKYAFGDDDKKQIVVIKMYKNNNEDFTLEIYDNGKGMDMSSSHQGFGLKLAHSLVKYQLKGELETYNDNGLHHKIHFSKGLIT